jgi:hypothetical protein
VATFFSPEAAGLGAQVGLALIYLSLRSKTAYAASSRQS